MHEKQSFLKEQCQAGVRLKRQIMARYSMLKQKKKTWLEVEKDSKHSSAARLFSHATYMGMAKVFNRVHTLIMFSNKGMYLELTCYTV